MLQVFASILAVGCMSVDQSANDNLLTIAEKSDFHATAHYQEVMTFCHALAQRSDVVRLGELGTSAEGRSIPLLILADPPVETPQQAKKSGKLVVFAFGDIHAGEVCGKEALLMLARDVANDPKHPLLKNLVVVLAPIYNPDGNEHFGKNNRPGQVGPDEGMGQRPNAQGLDLNRDYVKLESPEARAQVRFLNQWNPAVIIDTHTTNGSHHQYTITYEGPRNPAGDPRIIQYVREKMLPQVSRQLKDHSGYKSFFYGNLNADKTVWSTTSWYPALARYGTPYRGMRNRLAILSEAYAYASYKDRILATRDFVRLCFEYAAQNSKDIKKLIKKVDTDTTEAGQHPKNDDLVAIAGKLAPYDKKVIVKGFVETKDENGKIIVTDKPHDYEVEHVSRFKPTLSVKRPFAYLFPPSFAAVTEKLQQHGIKVDQLREDIELDVEVYPVDEVKHQVQPFQKHNLLSLEATATPDSRQFPAGTILVRTGQPLGSLIVYLLEPMSQDGLGTWNFFDSDLTKGSEYPVVRLPSPVPMTYGPVRPLPEDRTFNRRITYNDMFGTGKRPRLGGSTISMRGWLDDGEHYLQVRNGQLYKVQAATGRSQIFYDKTPMTEALAKLPGIDKKQARKLTAGIRFHTDEARTAALFTHDKDLYYARFDGSLAVRLTHTPKREELATFSPDGRWIAFVRENNLYVVDVETQTERALTTDGTDIVYNGKADWVYYEEIFSRNHQAYWWSPDSTHIAFMQYDDTPVNKFVIVDNDPIDQRIENTHFPQAGDPNPHIKLGIVNVTGSKPKWADLSNQDADAIVISGVGWMPDSQNAYFYLQDRAQTWLDFMTVSRDGGKANRLFHDKTQAWIESPGSPYFLKDGSFIITSERSGWKHLYHYDTNGELVKQITSGPWEVRRVNLVDEDNGWVYVSGTRDSPIANNLYRVHLDGSNIQRLTKSPGSHSVSVSPKGNYYIDTWSSHTTPTRVALFKSDGSPVRTLDSNPVYNIEEYQLGDYDLFQIEMSDGFKIEASMVKPPDFDPNKKYPVWFMTYAGPHAPTVRDTFSRGRTYEQMIAQMGIIVFRCDPRSASGKGAVSAWSAYRQLGIQEMKDIAEAVTWVGKLPYVDASRIGMSGHSYGGFMTSYAMTHSALFKCGVAGAPVTDWRLYDTIYTERYMDTPKNNKNGYNKTSVVKAAKDLHGKLLIIHGTIDDNVHMQNTTKLISALQKANKDFEMMIYPGYRHGIWGAHYNRLIVDFMRRNLLKPTDTNLQNQEQRQQKEIAGEAHNRTHAGTR